MGTAPFFERAQVAAAEVIAGFDVNAFNSALNATSVGISLGSDAGTDQGSACADLLVRLCARLYPSLAVLEPGDTAKSSAARARLLALATAINPNIDVADHARTIVHLGVETPALATTDSDADTVIYLGCDDWTGQVSLGHPLSFGDGPLPVGAGIAACLGASALFRLLLDPTAARPADACLTALPEPPRSTSFTLPQRSALVGAGAVGQALLWTLARTPVDGDLHVVEPESVDLSNLQRYVLATTADVDKLKTTVAYDHVADTPVVDRHLTIQQHPTPWAETAFAASSDWDLVVAAVDSAEARRQTQASLPQRLVNGWTQAGDLGVSSHDFIQGACCACLYLPTGLTKNEDELVATALRIPEHLLDVRALLYSGGATPESLLSIIATRFGIDTADAVGFEDRPLRELYLGGICGGGLVPLTHDPQGKPVHVPLAHQSALAGVLMAARVLQLASGQAQVGTEVTRVDVRRDPAEFPHQRQAKDPRGLCLCQDSDYIRAYHDLWVKEGRHAQ